MVYPRQFGRKSRNLTYLNVNIVYCNKPCKVLEEKKGEEFISLFTNIAVTLIYYGRKAKEKGK